jgi:hypothetical protein
LAGALFYCKIPGPARIRSQAEEICPPAAFAKLPFITKRRNQTPVPTLLF